MEVKEWPVWSPRLAAASATTTTTLLFRRVPRPLPSFTMASLRTTTTALRSALRPVAARGAVHAAAAARVACATGLAGLHSSSSTSTSSRSLARRSASAMPASMPMRMRGLHVSAPVCGAGESDAELSGKLAEEISYEKESAAASATEGEPAFLADFRKDGVWKIEDQPGSDEIALTRDFGNEHIRVLFSIGDIDTAENEMDESDEVDAQKEEDDNSDAPSFPVRCAITISKVSAAKRVEVGIKSVSNRKNKR